MTVMKNVVNRGQECLSHSKHNGRPSEDFKQGSAAI